MSHKIQIFLAEDEPAILRGLAANIKQCSDDYEISGTAYNGIDALEHIRSQKPDIVITDIRMPMMDGLDLIEAAREICPDTYYIILTGYAEFEYAKRAMKLQVVDYLLKPVDPDALEELLCKLKEKLLLHSEKDIREYLSQNLYRDSEMTVNYNPLAGSTLYFLFAFYGTVASGMYIELATGSLIARDSDYSFLKGLPIPGGMRIMALRGNYMNETVFAILTDPDSCIPVQTVEDTARRIHEHLLSKDVFISCILSNPVSMGLDIQSHVRSCYLYAASHIIFGQSRFFSCHSENMQAHSDCIENIMVTEEVKELLKMLKPAMKPSDIEMLCRGLTGIWSGRESTQLQIQTDLRYTLNTALRKADSGRDMNPNPAELLASSSSYEELCQNLKLEFNKLCTGHTPAADKVPHTQALAWKVRDYLDQNYTCTVTYKNFTEIFGYNEKYISYIFKEEFGISPSKYILELRMTAAKNLMRQHPDMLLKDIAEAVGYDDQLYFSRVFKNSEGMSPKAYQKLEGK